MKTSMTTPPRSTVPRSALLRRIQANYAAEARLADCELAKLPQDRRVTQLGRPASGRKPSISLRIPADLLVWFKAQGRGYQSRIIEALEEERRRSIRRTANAGRA
jgi:uncharacterized protein (DUF4415 family)